MCKKMFFIFPAVVLLVFAGSASAQLNWTDWCPDNNDFNEPNNWDPNDQGPPGPGQGGITITGRMAEGRSWPTMWADVNTTVDSFGMSGRRTGTTLLPVADPCLVMWGRLTVEPGLIIIGSGWSSTGGEDRDRTGTVHMMPGSYWRTQRDPAASTVHGVWSTQQGGQGTVVMDGGEWVADGLTLSFNTGGGGTLRINDGVVRTYFLEMMRGWDPWDLRSFPEYQTIYIEVCTSNMDIREGSMIIDGDRRNNEIPYEKYVPYERPGYTDPYYDGREEIGIQGYIDRGWITAYGDPCDPCDPKHWYQPGNDDVNNWWMSKWAEVIVEYVPGGDMVKPDEPSQTGHTVVTAYLGDYNEPYGLSPRQNETGVLPTATLSWGPGDYVGTGGVPGSQQGNGHHVFIGTYEAQSGNMSGWNLQYPVGTLYGHIVGAQDANFLDIATGHPAGTLELDTHYVWTVVEANDANAPGGDWWWKPQIVHHFWTVGGKASNPNPKDGGEAGIKLGAPLNYELTWDRGYYAASTDGHVVYFGTNFEDVCDATGGAPQTPASYTATGLELGKEYFWRVDEVNTAGPDPYIWPGDVWSFTAGDYRVIDDFDYASSDEIYDFWKINGIDYFLPCSSMGGGAWIELDHGKMSYPYDNNDIEDEYGGFLGLDFFSEVRYEFPAPADLTDGDTLRALALDYTGTAGNAADPNYDRMYVGLESADGNMAIVLNPDVSAQKKPSSQFNIDLRDFSDAGVNVQGVVYLYLGFGIQCNPQPGTPGGEGVVKFDNIRVYPPRCVGHPGGVPYYGQLGDLNGDCTVDIKDMKLLSNAWLITDRLTGVPVAVADDDPCMMARWEFEGEDENDPNAWLNDPNGRMGSAADGTPYGDPDIVVDANRPESLPGNHVLYVDGNMIDDTNDYVMCGTWGGRDGDANFASKSYTLMVWRNQTQQSPLGDGWSDMLSMGESAMKLEMGMIFLMRQVHSVSSGIVTMSSETALLDFDTWYHVASTYEKLPDVNGGIARLYINGRLAEEVDGNEIAYVHSVDPNYDPNWCIGAQDYEGAEGDTPSFRRRIDRVYYGYLDDVRIYDRQLSEEEIMWLAGKRAPSRNYYAILPPAAYADTYSPEAKGNKIVNFKDMAKMAQEWLESALWPVIP